MLYSIITPTYNRAYCLRNLYDSLKRNSSRSFEWIIIDDGSMDETEEIVSQWLSENLIQIRYFKRENGGKTNALATAFSNKPQGKFTMVVDSDDVLVDNFEDIIVDTIKNIEEGEIGAIFLKAYTDSTLVGAKFLQESSSYIDLYYGRNKTRGDKLFLVHTNIYSKSIVPSFTGEKLVPESVFYINMDGFGKFRCVNKVLYIGDYLSDGLSNNQIKLAARNINGFLLEKSMLQKCSLPFLDKLKNEVKYITYSKASGRSFLETYEQSFNKFLTALLFIPSILLTARRLKELKKNKA